MNGVVREVNARMLGSCLGLENSDAIWRVEDKSATVCG